MTRRKPGPAPTPLFERILAKVVIPPGDPVQVCWEWRGALSKKRRGQRRPVIQEGGTGTFMRPVARVLCEVYHGPPPSPGHEAGHICPEKENHQCVNPHHLRWQTRTENEQWKQQYQTSPKPAAA